MALSFCKAGLTGELIFNSKGKRSWAIVRLELRLHRGGRPRMTLALGRHLRLLCSTFTKGCSKDCILTTKCCKYQIVYSGVYVSHCG